MIGFWIHNNKNIKHELVNIEKEKMAGFIPINALSKDDNFFVTAVFLAKRIDII